MSASTEPMAGLPSASRNIHVVSCRRDGSMLVSPGSFGRDAALACIAAIPAGLYLCQHFNAPAGLWTAAILFPLFGAGGFFIGHIASAKLGTRVILNAKTRKIQITGFRHGEGREFSFNEIISVQRLYEGVRGETSDAGAWTAYQINLVFTGGERYNLLDSGGKRQLDRLGEALAKQMGVPFEKHEKTDEQSAAPRMPHESDP